MPDLVVVNGLEMARGVGLLQSGNVYILPSCYRGEEQTQLMEVR